MVQDVEECKGEGKSHYKIQGSLRCVREERGLRSR